MRPARLDRSALSPAEYDTYVPVLEAFQVDQVKPSSGADELGAVWAWLKPRATRSVEPSTEKQILSFFRATPTAAADSGPAPSASGLVLALLRLIAHSAIAPHLTRDLIFIQTDPAEILLSLPQDSPTIPQHAPAQASANPFRRSLAGPPLTLATAHLPSPASSSIASPLAASARSVSGQSVASASSSRGPPPPPPAKRRESALLSPVLGSNPFRQPAAQLERASAVELPMSPPPSEVATGGKEWQNGLGRRPSQNGATPPLPPRPRDKSPGTGVGGKPVPPPRSSSTVALNSASATQQQRAASNPEGSNGVADLPPPPMRRSSLKAPPMVASTSAPRTKLASSSHIGLGTGAAGGLRSTPSPLPWSGGADTDGASTPKGTSGRGRSGSSASSSANAGGAPFTYEPAQSPKRERGGSSSQNPSPLLHPSATSATSASPFFRSISANSTFAIGGTEWNTPPLAEDAISNATAPLPSHATFAYPARRESIQALPGAGLSRAKTLGSRATPPPPPPKRRESLQLPAKAEPLALNPFSASGGASIAGYMPNTSAGGSGYSAAAVKPLPTTIPLAAPKPAHHRATSASQAHRPPFAQAPADKRRSSVTPLGAQKLGQDLSQLLERGGKTGEGWLASARSKLGGEEGDQGLAMRRRRREERERLVSGGSVVRLSSEEEGEEGEEEANDEDGHALAEDEGFETRDERRRERIEVERRIRGDREEGTWVPL